MPHLLEEKLPPDTVVAIAILRLVGGQILLDRLIFVVLENSISGFVTSVFDTIIHSELIQHPQPVRCKYNARFQNFGVWVARLIDPDGYITGRKCQCQCAALETACTGQSRRNGTS